MYDDLQLMGVSVIPPLLSHQPVIASTSNGHDQSTLSQPQAHIATIETYYFDDANDPSICVKQTKRRLPGLPDGFS